MYVFSHMVSRVQVQRYDGHLALDGRPLGGPRVRTVARDLAHDNVEGSAHARNRYWAILTCSNVASLTILLLPQTGHLKRWKIVDMLIVSHQPHLSFAYIIDF
jgi:hypothetical protein